MWVQTGPTRVLSGFRGKHFFFGAPLPSPKQGRTGLKILTLNLETEYLLQSDFGPVWKG